MKHTDEEFARKLQEAGSAVVTPPPTTEHDERDSSRASMVDHDSLEIEHDTGYAIFTYMFYCY